MADYIEYIQLGTGGEAHPVRDREAHFRLDGLDGLGLLNKIYPVGSLYFSAINISPDQFFGGTWERIEDRFLLAAGSNYGAGSTGGEATHTLTVDEMPAHTHEQEAHNHKYLGQKGPRASGSSNYTLVDATNNSGNLEVTSTLIGDTTATNKNTGGGQSHNNMPPYLAVYVWQRTA